MTRKRWLDLGPSLLVAVGIILSTLIAVLTAESGWLVLAGPLLLAVTVAGAGAWGSRLNGESWRPSGPALIMGCAVLLASSIVALRDPSLVKTLIPIVGAGAWVADLARPDGRRRTCKGS